MKILLLGASGLLGHNVLQALLTRGHEVVALLRRKGSIRLPQGHWLEIEGSLLDYSALLQASEGCEAIVNCAGITDMSLLRYEDYLPVNCDLSARLLRLMHETGIRRLVHVSTANTIGYGSAQQPANEDAPMQPPFANSFYARSKRAGEQQLIESARRMPPDSHIVIVNPGFIIGAYDVKPSSGRLLLAAYRKPLMAAPRGGKSFIAATAAAEAVVNALTMGRTGQRYLLTGENLSLSQFYRLQASVCGYRQHIFRLPNALVRMAGYVGDFLRTLGISTQLSSCNVQQLLVSEFYDDSLASRELAMPAVPIRQAIADFFDYHRRCKTKSSG